jgi:hypothetical protein
VQDYFLYLTGTYLDNQYQQEQHLAGITGNTNDKLVAKSMTATAQVFLQTTDMPLMDTVEGWVEGHGLYVHKFSLQ